MHFHIHAILLYTHKINQVRSLTSFSLQSLKDTFDHFTSMWINMKYHLKAKESDDSQYYKFKSRMISIEDIFKEDVLLLSDMESEGSVVDNEEKLEHDFFKITVLPMLVLYGCLYFMLHIDVTILFISGKN